jgi:similar to stage IV sporulation protein
VATVNVVEGAPKPRMIDRDTPCDVVAGRDAVVRKVIVYEGEAKAAAGDMVKSGQVLVDGTVTLPAGIKRVHARADVLAGVWYEGRGSAPLFTETGMKTGARAETRVLEFAGYALAMDGDGEPPFEDFDISMRPYYLLGAGLKGPRLNVTRYDEVQRYPGEADFAGAKEAAFLQAAAQANAYLPQDAEIIDTRTDYSFDGANIIVKVYIETQENIAVESPIR